MNKTQINSGINDLLVEHKASKKLTAAIQDLLVEYMKNGSDKKPTIEKLVVINETEYQWCNRHEVYEVRENFKNEKSTCCRLADARWANHGKNIKALDTEFALAFDSDDYAKAKEIKVLTEVEKELRASRYTMSDDLHNFPEVSNYDYDKATCEL